MGIKEIRRHIHTERQTDIQAKIKSNHAETKTKYFTKRKKKIKTIK